MCMYAMSLVQSVIIKPNLKFVLYALANFANEEGISFPSIKTLSDYTGFDERSVRRLIKELICQKLIEKVNRFRENLSQKSNQYRLIFLNALENKATEEVCQDEKNRGDDNLEADNLSPLEQYSNNINNNNNIYKHNNINNIYHTDIRAREKKSKTNSLSTALEFKQLFETFLQIYSNTTFGKLIQAQKWRLFEAFKAAAKNCVKKAEEIMLNTRMYVMQWIALREIYKDEAFKVPEMPSAFRWLAEHRYENVEHVDFNEIEWMINERNGKVFPVGHKFF